MIGSSQIDKLGDRLRSASIVDNDIRLLDEWRRSFGGAYETVVTIARGQLLLEPTGRPAKSTGSIVAKLQRESIRLSQIQDIAGCRVVVADVPAQDRVVESLIGAFPGAAVVDRRASPQFGYRAVHVIVRVVGKLVEIQVRSLSQHLWAELSEKLSDVIDPAVKYGGGPEPFRQLLVRLSDHVAQYEDLEVQVQSFPVEVMATQEGRDLDARFRDLRENVYQLLAEAIEGLRKLEGPPQ